MSNTFAQSLRFGTSLSFVRKLDRESLRTVSEAGIAAGELSFNFDYYMNRICFPENAEKYAAIAREEGVEL